MQWIRPDTNFPFMSFTRIFFPASAAVVAVSLVLAVYPGPNYGIDFKGGTEIQFRLSKPMDIGSVRAAIGKAGFSRSDLVRIGGGGDRYRVRLEAVSALTEERGAGIKSSFKKTFKDQVLAEFKQSPGGDKITVAFEKPVDPGEIEKAARSAGLRLRKLSVEHMLFEKKDVTKGAEGEEEQELSTEERERCLDPVCPFGRPEDNTYEIFLESIADTFMTSMPKALGNVTLRAEEIQWVGPAVGRQLRDAGIKSILYALGLILLYVAFRFDLRFAPGAVLCLFHDVAITTGLFVVMRREVNLPFIAALLTIIGYSLNDTIVVYDRIRENLARSRERDLRLVVDKSINETLSRTLLTSFTTFIAIAPILILARGTIQNFALAMAIGIIVGTYSSIYIASPLSVWIDDIFFAVRRARRRPA